MKSGLQNITCGVPPGPILNPKSSFNNDDCNVSNLLHFIPYTEDTNILYKQKNIETLCNAVRLLSKNYFKCYLLLSKSISITIFWGKNTKIFQNVN